MYYVSLRTVPVPLPFARGIIARSLKRQFERLGLDALIEDDGVVVTGTTTDHTSAVMAMTTLSRSFWVFDAIVTAG